jgi:hypothetical protein
VFFNHLVEGEADGAADAAAFGRASLLLMEPLVGQLLPEIGGRSMTGAQRLSDEISALDSYG